MKKIETLTAEQQAQFHEYVRRWTEIGLSTSPADHAGAEAGVRQAYQAAGLPPPKRIIWCQSPLSALRTMETERRMNCPGMGVGILDSVVCRIYDNVWVSVRESVWVSVRESVWSSVGDNVRASVWDSVGDTVRASVRASVRDSVLTAIGGQHESSWLAPFDYFAEQCGLQSEVTPLQGLMSVARTAGWWWPFENVVFITERHHLLKRNAHGQLHAEGGPAVAWPDGWQIHALNGIRVPAWLAESPPDDLDARKILQSENVDQRREGIRRAGMSRMVAQLQPEILSEQGEYQLLAVGMNHGKPWRFLKMVNPSTGCIHIEAVPRECETVQHALNWRRAQNINHDWLPDQLT